MGRVRIDEGEGELPETTAGEGQFGVEVERGGGEATM